MAYQALYRKFRPQEFSDVKGQDHIVTTLRNQIKADRIGHLSVLRYKRNGKDYHCQDFCEGSELREPGRRQSLRGVPDLPGNCVGSVDECDRD